MANAAYDFDTATLTRRRPEDITREMVVALHNLDVLARAMERKWGSCRLPALVPDELAQRFYSQHRKVSSAMREGRDTDAIAEIGKMISAWRFLDQEADRLGAEPIHPSVWEVPLSDGSVAAIVRDEDEAAAVDPVERNMRVFMLSEIGRLIEAMPTLCAIKEEFPGAKVRPVRIQPPDEFWATGETIPF